MRDHDLRERHNNLTDYVKQRISRVHERIDDLLERVQELENPTKKCSKCKQPIEE